jgi:chromosome segregation ATPase
MMALNAEEDFPRPVTLAVSALALIGWVLAGYLWSQASRTEDEMTTSLHAAEKARESLAADLQNLQKAAGTAADLKVQATEAEKRLSEASAARASAQNELADLTKQINDAKLAVSGAQEEASVKSRDLQSVDARLKEETDRLAALQNQNQEFTAEQIRLQAQAEAARSALADAQNQTAATEKQLQTLQGQIAAATAELNSLQQQIHDAQGAASQAH